MNNSRFGTGRMAGWNNAVVPPARYTTGYFAPLRYNRWPFQRLLTVRALSKQSLPSAPRQGDAQRVVPSGRVDRGAVGRKGAIGHTAGGVGSPGRSAMARNRAFSTAMAT